MVTLDEIQNFRKKCISFEKKVHESHSSIASEIRDVIERCDNEILRNELMELGYETMENINRSINAHSYKVASNYRWISDICTIIYWSDKCKMSWPDNDDIVPKPGNYYVELRFGTGPYLISQHYEKARPYFSKMWNEFLSLNPDVTDTHNNELLWEIHSENAVKVWNTWETVTKKYIDMFNDDMKKDKEMQIAELEAKIEAIKKS